MAETWPGKMEIVHATIGFLAKTYYPILYTKLYSICMYVCMSFTLRGLPWFLRLREHNVSQFIYLHWYALNIC